MSCDGSYGLLAMEPAIDADSLATSISSGWRPRSMTYAGAWLPAKTSSFPTSAASTFSFGGALFRSGDQEAYGMCERSTHESLTTLG
jgi:hypothetical protein